MENDEYLKGLSQGYGMRLQIHDQDTFPLPDEEGIFVSSSYETHVGLRLVNIWVAVFIYSKSTNKEEGYLFCLLTKHVCNLANQLCLENIWVFVIIKQTNY